MVQNIIYVLTEQIVNYGGILKFRKSQNKVQYIPQN